MAENVHESKVETVLVAGATGYLGRHVVAALRQKGYPVRALARPSSRHKLTQAVDEVFVGEATDHRTLAGLCDGVDVVFSSLGIRSFRRRPTFWEVDFRANMNVLYEAVRAGVRQFIFVSVLHGDRLRDRIQWAEARERVADAARVSGLTWTVLRPTGFFNDMAELFRMVQQGGIYVVVGDGTSRINPIHGADLAAQVVRAIEDPALHNHAASFGGPDILTFRAIGELAAAVLDREVRVVSLPPALPAAAGALLSPFNPNGASALQAMGILFSTDAVGEPVGTHHLKDFFLELSRGMAADDATPMA